jgi:TatD DNase family protein
MKIIDSHSHIDYLTHKIQRDVVGTVVCATKESQWQNLIDLMNDDDCVYGAFGIHPWFIDSCSNKYDSNLQTLLETNQNFMIGEIGLDKYKPNIEKQFDVFIKQFDLAIRFQRTVFIHCVGAWDKILYVLKQYKKSELPNIVFHAFNGSENILNNLLKNYKDNIYFSFGKNALYDRNRRITQIPIDKILVESDGDKCVNLIDVVNKMSIIKNDTNAENIIYNNTNKVLKNG